MGTTTHALIIRHACLLDRTESEMVPRGWHAILDLLFRDIAEALAGHPTIKLEIQCVTEKFGALRVHVDAEESNDSETALTAVYPLITAAELKSSRTCQVCGAMGQRRHRGRVTTLCDTHDRNPMPDDEDSVAALDSLYLSDTDMATITASTDAVDDLQSGGLATLDVASDHQTQRGGLHLYSLRAVADALGRPSGLDEDAFMPARTETEHESRLAAILARGEAGAWRGLAEPSPECLGRLDVLDAAAPHMSEVTALVRRHVQAALTIGVHFQLPPLLVLGEPGMGKSWYMARLGEALGLPVRTYPMSASSLSEGLQGAHPSWRNAGPGLVARTLLQEQVANPLILVDEIDKANAGSWNADPYRPFYALLEPSGARVFKDEFLQFELNASAISWLLAGNQMAPLPEPIRDRLTVIEVPSLSSTHLAAVAASIYAEANAINHGYFDPDLAVDVLDILLALSPRGIRKAVQDAMVRAASEGRRRLAVADMALRGRKAALWFGFTPSSRR